MNRPFSSGRTRLVGHGITYPVPIPLDPAPYAGALAVGLDPVDNRRKLYFSDGTSWQRDIFDTEIVEQIERFIDDLFLNGFDEANLPDPTDPANLRRYAFNNDRGLPGFVWDNEWKYLTDEARTAEIAEDVAANVVRIIDDPQIITVHHSNPAADFTSFKQALDSLGGNARALTPDQFLVQIIALTGHIETEQIFINSNDLSWVILTAEDDEVVVAENQLTTIDPGSGLTSLVPYIWLSNTNAPVFQVNFVSDESGVVGGGTSHGCIARSSFFFSNPEDRRITANGVSVKAGFNGFDRNIQANDGAFIRLRDFSCLNARGRGIGVFNSVAWISNSTVTGWETEGIRVSGSSSVLAEGTDFRKSGSSSTSDIVVVGGARLSLASNVSGGTSIDPNIIRQEGLILDRRSSVGKTEEGSGPNGRYWRFANGLQVCTRTIADFDWQDSTRQIYGFEADFIANPSVSASTERTGNNQIWNAMADMVVLGHINEWQLVSTSPTPDAQSFEIYLSAIGRWR